MKHIACALMVASLLGAAPAEAQDAQAEAKVHFQRGMAAFELGKFEEALGEYERAYALAPLPGFLFNIGQCHRNLGNYKKAIHSFRFYLRKKPEARNRDAVETLIAELEQKLKSQRPRRVPVYVPPDRIPPPPPLPPVTTPVYKKWWLWTLVIVAAGGAATGIYFAARPKSPSLPETDFSLLDYSRK